MEPLFYTNDALSSEQLETLASSFFQLGPIIDHTAPSSSATLAGGAASCGVVGDQGLSEEEVSEVEPASEPMFAALFPPVPSPTLELSGASTPIWAASSSSSPSPLDADLLSSALLFTASGSSVETPSTLPSANPSDNRKSGPSKPSSSSSSSSKASQALRVTLKPSSSSSSSQDGPSLGLTRDGRPRKSAAGRKPIVRTPTELEARAAAERERNRIAAQASRRRRSSAWKTLTAENAALRDAQASLEAENAALRGRLAALENTRPIV